MTRSRSKPKRRSPAEAADLQLACGDSEIAVDARTAERLARLEADKELVLRLGLQGFAGREWDAFATVLAEYGLQVFRAWLQTGKVFALCRHSGPRVKINDDDDATEIACDVVAAAIKAFRDDVLIPGIWDPTKGASLKTFFIGQCKLQFANAYRRWRKETCRRQPGSNELAAEIARRPAPWPDAVTTIELHRMKPRLEENTIERVQGLTAMGYTSAEIAEIDRTTEGAVNAKLYRARQKLGKP